MSTNTEPKKKVYRIRVTYKCGTFFDFDCYEFSCTSSAVKWEVPPNSKFPVYFNVAEVQSAWCLGVRDEQ